jgi:hypothetical protein
LRTGRHGVDDHGVVAVDAKYADLEQIAVMSWTNTHRKSSSSRHWAMALRVACSMSSSATPCFRATRATCIIDKISCHRSFVKEPCQMHYAAPVPRGTRIRLFAMAYTGSGRVPSLASARYGPPQTPLQAARKPHRKANTNRSPRLVMFCEGQRTWARNPENGRSSPLPGSVARRWWRRRTTG